MVLNSSMTSLEIVYWFLFCPFASMSFTWNLSTFLSVLQASNCLLQLSDLKSPRNIFHSSSGLTSGSNSLDYRYLVSTAGPPPRLLLPPKLVTVPLMNFRLLEVNPKNIISNNFTASWFIRHFCGHSFAISNTTRSNRLLKVILINLKLASFITHHFFATFFNNF